MAAVGGGDVSKAPLRVSRGLPPRRAHHLLDARPPPPRAHAPLAPAQEPTERGRRDCGGALHVHSALLGGRGSCRVRGGWFRSPRRGATVGMSDCSTESCAVFNLHIASGKNGREFYQE
ncbi:uncharacterized protein LOC133922729 [Phragmites australis]|uniref:uncharacterized protein LOC133922729 n=1 Tax=Phragmites australis TaxID=29695 RepID=UPI002D76F019|nr:uncharacterized protein LOC133922729 [Phragmites australis]